MTGGAQSQGKLPTLKDVARRAGVSIATASRVINGKQNVDLELRDKVLVAVQSLNFRPNIGAKKVRLGRTSIIGCIVREINIPALSEFIGTAQRLLANEGYFLLVASSKGVPHIESMLLNRLISLQCDGYLLGAYSSPDDGGDALLQELGAPVVAIDRDRPDWLDAVSADHTTGVFEATRALIRLGHRRIALITGMHALAPSRNRLLGFEAAFKESSLDVPHELVRFAGFSKHDGYVATSALLGEDRKPTAIIAGGNDMLAGVLSAIKARGLRVPDDVSVAGSSDTELSQLVRPPVTVYRWDQGRMAQLAVELLLKRIRNPAKDHKGQRLVVPIELVERASMCRPNIASY